MKTIQVLPITSEMKEWSLIELVDYIVEHYHHGTLERLNLLYQNILYLSKTKNIESTVWNTVLIMLQNSSQDLKMHFMKEEQVLFPYIKEIQQSMDENRKPEEFHCGSVIYPIQAMITEHENELERYANLISLIAQKTEIDSNNFILDDMKAFIAELEKHIYIENEVLFPKAITMEEKLNDQ